MYGTSFPRRDKSQHRELIALLNGWVWCSVRIIIENWTFKCAHFDVFFFISQMFVSSCFNFSIRFTFCFFFEAIVHHYLMFVWHSFFVSLFRVRHYITSWQLILLFLSLHFYFCCRLLLHVFFSLYFHRMGKHLSLLQITTIVQLTYHFNVEIFTYVNYVEVGAQ